MTALDYEDELTLPERYGVSEIFRLIFTSIKNGRILKNLANFLKKIKQSKDGFFSLFDAYFNYLTKYCSPLYILEDEGNKILEVLD